MITDHQDIAELQAAIYACLDSLEKQRDGYAMARQVVEYDSDRRKQLLSVCVQSAAGKSISEREHTARASKGHNDGLNDLAAQFADAHKIMSRYYCTNTKLDALRSILSTQKVLAREI